MDVRILLADDHRLVRQGLRAVLEGQRGWRVVGEAENGHQAVRLARESAPGVAIVDVSMPDLNGIEATRQILAENPRVKVVALTVHADPKLVAEMLRAGASAYVLKEGALEELERAVRAVLAGEIYLSGQVVRGFVDQYVRAPRAPSEAVLSDREREVLQPLAEGKTTREIAELLNVSVKTVETHRQHIMRKLGLYTLP
ncbi:MAG: response regulator transcription factor, partial [Deltaproteobacteria bacterium]|nr:response regulator transcription factor [Deltaproteobacteria bacterium]